MTAPYPEDSGLLEDQAAAAVADARAYVDDDIGAVLERRSRDYLEGDDVVERDAFHDYVDRLFDELDDLYGVASDEGVRDYLHGRIGYDWTIGEHVKRTGRNSVLAGSMVGGMAAGLSGGTDIFYTGMEAAQQEPLLGVAGVAAAVGGVAAVDKVTKRIGTGNYVHMPYPITQAKHRDINISPDAAPAGFAYPVAVAEVTHAYQDLWNSPTFDHPVFEEGMDLGAQLAVGDRFMDEDAAWPEDNAWRRCHALLYAHGVTATPTAEDGIDPAVLEDVGLDPDEAEAAAETFTGHSGRRSNALLGAAGLFTAAQRDGYDVYEDVFHGEYDRLPDWVPGV